MLERLAELMHEEWLDVMAEQDWHSPEDCPKWDARAQRSGWPFQPCENCRSGLVSWEDPPEAVKEVNRRGVLRFFRELGITPEQAKRGVNVGKAVEAATSAQKNVQWLIDMFGDGTLVECEACPARGYADFALARLADTLCALGEGLNREPGEGT